MADQFAKLSGFVRCDAQDHFLHLVSAAQVDALQMCMRYIVDTVMTKHCHGKAGYCTLQLAGKLAAAGLTAEGSTVASVIIVAKKHIFFRI